MEKAPIRVLILVFALGLAGCGGGGSSSAPATGSGSAGGSGGGTGSGSTGGSVTITTPVWSAGVFPLSTSYQDKCEVPRTGIDPLTGQAYSDQAGSELLEKFWLRSWSDELYLWYSEIPDRDPASIANKIEYFDLLKSPALTPSGNPRDRFHFTAPTSEFIRQSQSGVSYGYGLHLSVDRAQAPRNWYVDYVEPTSPAQLSGIERGYRLLSVDGVDMVNSSSQAELEQALLALFPSTLGEVHSFSFSTPATRNVQLDLTSAEIVSLSVPQWQVIDTPSGEVAYIQFNNHNAIAEQELFNTFSRPELASVTDLILDLRYNSGGYLAIASQVAWMIAGPATTGKTFERLTFNDKATTLNPVTGEALEPTPFFSETLGLSLSAGQPLPTLALDRVFVLTGPETCSASESIINSLDGIGIEVIQIGATTCGKPYGFYPRDNCGTTYFTIQFRGENDIGFGDYADGFSPANTQGLRGVVLAGCSVADDHNHQLGDPEEALLKSALSWRQTISCPLPPPPAPFSLSSGSFSGYDGISPLSLSPGLESFRPYTAGNRLYGLTGQGSMPR